MSKSSAKGRRKERHQDAGPAAPEAPPSDLHPVVAGILSVFRNRRERRIFLMLTIPVLAAQYFFWSWMRWSAIIMFP